jgi:hypothetical protein
MQYIPVSNSCQAVTLLPHHITISVAIAARLLRMLPRCLVFDLDGCVWDPEMYELWGGGGAPFKANKDGTLSDKAGGYGRLP